MNNTPSEGVKSNKIKIIIIAVAVLFLAIGIGAVEYTSQTGFCNSCHEMNTAFAGWETGVHHSQHCYDCHIDKGLVAKIKIKVNGLKEVYIHLTQDVNMEKVKSDIPERRCLNCHSMEDKKKYSERIVTFHKQHKDLKFDCLICHTSAAHSKNQFDGFQNTKCLSCHQTTKKNV